MFQHILAQNYLMRTFLAGCLCGVGLIRWLKYIGKRTCRCLPFVALLVDFPRLRLPVFEPHIATRIGWATEANLIPGVGMRVVGINYVLHKQHPEMLHGHLAKDV